MKKTSKDVAAIVQTKELLKIAHSQRESQLLSMASVDVRLIASLWHNAKKWSRWPDDGTTIPQMITVILDAEFPSVQTHHHHLDLPA